MIVQEMDRTQQYESLRKAVIEADPSIEERVTELCKNLGREGEEMTVLDEVMWTFPHFGKLGMSEYKSRIFSAENEHAYREWRYANGYEKPKRVKLLYIYGYGGSRLSSSAVKMRQLLPADRFEVLCYDYPQRDCAVALRFLKEKIRRHHIDVVMGSSLGAFLTLCLDVDIPKLVVNPCLVPSVELPKLKSLPGKPVPTPALIATYAPYESAVFNHLPEGSHCFMSEQDELLGNRYLDTMQQHLPTTPIPGGHRLSEDAVKKIIGTIQKKEGCEGC